MVQVCALCGEIIELGSNLLTLYFEIDGMGAFELNIHAQCLTKLCDPDHLKNNGENCVLCGLEDTNNCILVRQLDNLSYPMHTNCLEHLLEQFAALFASKTGEARELINILGIEDEDQSHQEFIRESKN